MIFYAILVISFIPIYNNAKTLQDFDRRIAEASQKKNTNYLKTYFIGKCMKLFLKLFFARFLTVVPNHRFASDYRMLCYAKKLHGLYKMNYTGPRRIYPEIPDNVAVKTAQEMSDILNAIQFTVIGSKRRIMLKRAILVFKDNLDKGFSAKALNCLA